MVKHEFGEKCALNVNETVDGWMDGCVDGWMDYPVVLLLCKVYIFLRIHVLPLFFKLLAFTQFLSYLHVSYMIKIDLAFLEPKLFKI